VEQAPAEPALLYLDGAKPCAVGGHTAGALRWCLYRRVRRSIWQCDRIAQHDRRSEHVNGFNSCLHERAAGIGRVVC
jgi:hypothetical protein